MRDNFYCDFCYIGANYYCSSVCADEMSCKLNRYGKCSNCVEYKKPKKYICGTCIYNKKGAAENEKADN